MQYICYCIQNTKHYERMWLYSFACIIPISHTHTHTHTQYFYAGLNGGAVAGIVISISIAVTFTILCSIYLSRIMTKLVEIKRRRCKRRRATVPSSEPSLSYRITDVETQRAESCALQLAQTTGTEAVVPRDPQLSSKAPPSYQHAHEFQLVAEEDTADFEKPPAYNSPVLPSYLSIGVTYPPMHQLTEPAFLLGCPPILFPSPPPPPLSPSPSDFSDSPPPWPLPV